MFVTACKGLLLSNPGHNSIREYPKVHGEGITDLSVAWQRAATKLTKMASIPKKSQGPATRHLLASEGPSSYQLNFYSTTYSTKYPKSEKFPSASFRHKGTGYSANFRPTVYYNKEVDRTQNPTIA